MPIAGVLKFPSKTIHGRHVFAPGAAYGFEDPDAVVYFRRAFGAEKTDEEPGVVVTAAELDIDPDTVFADGEEKGRKVMEARNG